VTIRWLVTGAGGMLGRDLVDVLSAPDGTAPGETAPGVTALTRGDLDIRDAAAVSAAIADHRIVINAAAWTDVDAAEADEPAATEINGDGVAVLAKACEAAGAVLLHVSTDYVFPGDASTPYAEDAPTAPVNAYGRSKLAGERAVLAHGGYVVRTSWLYGEHGRNFVSTMLALAAQRDQVTVVDDQRGQPTWSYALAQRLCELGKLALAGAAPAGAYHGTASGETTWYGLARAVFLGAGLDPARVLPTTSDRFVRPARRPAYSVLGHGRWAQVGLPPMAHWQDALRDALPRLIARQG
jgi:dTDP-4-dehydrorhamnose reductase